MTSNGHLWNELTNKLNLFVHRVLESVNVCFLLIELTVNVKLNLLNVMM